MDQLTLVLILIAISLGGCAYALMLAYTLGRTKDEKEYKRMLNDNAQVAIINVRAEVKGIIEKAIAGEMDNLYQEESKRLTKLEGGISERIAFMIHETLAELPEMKNVLLLPEVMLRNPTDLDTAIKDLQSTRTTIEIVNNNCKEIQTALEQLTDHTTTLKDFIALKISSNEAEARARFAQMNTPPVTPRTESATSAPPQAMGDLGIRPIGAVAPNSAQGPPGSIQQIPPMVETRPKVSKARRIFNAVKP